MSGYPRLHGTTEPPSYPTDAGEDIPGEQDRCSDTEHEFTDVEERASARVFLYCRKCGLTRRLV